jgi:hypothetical protein
VLDPIFTEASRQLVQGDVHPLPALFRHVQAMPYRFPGPRDAKQTLASRAGTCAGKNYLLRELLLAAGVPCAHLIATCDLRESLPALPAHLRELAKSGPLPDVHSLLTAVGPDGPVLVDASWDPSLRAHGFTVQGDWDGRSDTAVAVKPHAIYAVCGEDPIVEKEAVRTRLYRGRGADLDRRNLYLTLLSEWMQTLRQ